MRLRVVQTGLAALDALAGVDAAGLFIGEDERPLRGLAGCVDWRLCGALSRVLATGWYAGARGDALLMPTRGRIPPSRLICFGVGPSAELDAGAAAALFRRAGEALWRAGARAVVTELPPVAGVDPAGLARLFLAEMSGRFRGERMVLAGDAKALARALEQAGPERHGVEIEAEPPAGPLTPAARPWGAPRLAGAT